MKRLFLFILVVSLGALAACNQQPAPQPTSEPVVLPTEAPAVVEPTAVPVPTEEPAPEIVVDPALIDTLWLWTHRDAATPIDVANPENYNLMFNADGTFFAGLDCNRGNGTYFTPGDGSITIELGMTTLAMCADDSLAGEMTAGLASAASYQIIEDGEILLVTSSDGSTDSYRSADTFTAAPPALENADADLIDRVWQWEGRTSGEQSILVWAPEDHTLTFNDDGTFFAVLDCNVGGGTYTSDGPGNLAMELGRTTLAMCADDSLANQMKTMFGPTISYAFDEDGEVLLMTHEDGTVDSFRAITDKTPSLVGTRWQWLGTVTGEGPVSVEDSSRYLIEFMADGSAVITADCNNVIAQFTSEDNLISITPGPSTLVACPEDSQADLFVSQLGGAAIYFFRDGDLYIDLFASSGTMHFAPVPEIDLTDPESGEPVGVVNAPDGVFLRTGPGTNFPSVGAAAQGDSGTLIGISDNGQWYVAEAPARFGGQVWVFGQFIDATGAENLPVVPTPPLPNNLAGRTWRWVGTTTPVQSIRPNDPNRYTIEFLTDGTAAIQADCNRVVAAYTTDGQSITITPGPSTLAMCPPDSKGDLFVQQLSGASIFFYQGGDLYIDLFASGGTMRFAPNAVAGPAGPESVTDLPFRVVSFGPAGTQTPIIDGTDISIQFDSAAGQVSGTSGCNNFFGAFNTQSGAFSMGPFGSTMMFCGEPEGVMEQEASILEALGGATSFQWAVAPNSFITNGTITYTLADGTNGVINLVSP